MTDDREELLARVATLYYLQDLSQQEIADRVAVSRSNISRMLKEARERGIVEIAIRHPLQRNVGLELQLAERFGLREVSVCQTIVNDPHTTLARVAGLAAQLLDAALIGAHTLAISWGTTIHAVAQAFVPTSRHDVEVVQMMGGVGPNEPAIDGPALAQRLARPLTGRHRYLHAPLIVDTPETAQALLSQRNIAETLQIAARADVALVGIGALEPSASSLLRAGYLRPDEFARMRADGVVGDICARHFDLAGRPVAPQIDARTISVSHAQIAQIPLVIGAAFSAAKASAIFGALRGGYLDVLVTDSAAAEQVLQLAAQM